MGSKMEEQTEKTNSIHSLDRLYDVIASRKNALADDSYTAQLFAGAPEEPARKLCEEATEVLIEALNGDKEKLASESADLLYHSSWCGRLLILSRLKSGKRLIVDRAYLVWLKNRAASLNFLKTSNY